jgi:hypothetical protein
MTPLRQKLVRLILISVLPLSLLILLILGTNPYKLPLIGLMIPFSLIFFIVYQSVYWALGNTSLKARQRRRKLNAAIFAGALVTLALLQSVRQLSARDLIIIIVLIASLWFYVRRVEL